MTIAYSSGNGTFSLATRVHWDRVVKLPAIVLSLTVFASLGIAGHTAYVDAESDRLIVQTNQIVADALQAGSNAGAIDLRAMAR